MLFERLTEFYRDLWSLTEAIQKIPLVATTPILILEQDQKPAASNKWHLKTHPESRTNLNQGTTLSITS